MSSFEKKTLFPNGIAWKSADLKENESRWSIPVKKKIITEFKTKTARYILENESLNAYKKGDLFFNGLTSLAAQVKWELIRGVGFVYLSGLGKFGLTEEELRLFYLVFGLEMGKLSTRYGRLYDVYDRGFKQAISTKTETNFHTASTSVDSFPDLVGLLCIRPAQKGGENILVSALAVHEKMREERPDLLVALYQYFVRDVNTPDDDKSLEKLMRNRFPVFSQGKYIEGLTFRYMRYRIETGAVKSRQPLTKTVVAALDYLDKTMNENEMMFNLLLDKGDVMYLNNHTIAHNRKSYKDFKKRRKKRLHVRSWIHVD